MLEKGLRIKGTGIGERVKGHKWERQMKTKIDDRKKAMEEMPEMIRLWKQVCIGMLRNSDVIVSRGMLTFSLFLLKSVVMVVAGRNSQGNKRVEIVWNEALRAFKLNLEPFSVA